MNLTKDKLPIEPSYCLVKTKENDQEFYHIAQYMLGEWVTHSEVLYYVTEWEYLDMVFVRLRQLQAIEEGVAKFYPEIEDDEDFSLEEEGSLASIGEFVASQLGYL